MTLSEGASTCVEHSRACLASGSGHVSGQLALSQLLRIFAPSPKNFMRGETEELLSTRVYHMRTYEKGSAASVDDSARLECTGIPARLAAFFV